VKLAEEGRLGKESESGESTRRAEDPSGAAAEDASKQVVTDEELPSISGTPNEAGLKILTDEPNSDKEYRKKRQALMKVIDKISEERSEPHK